jgi:hypothetical protein
MKTKNLLLGFLLLTSYSLKAQTITWGTSVGNNTNSLSAAVLSDGTQMASAVTWDLGYFGNAFVPTATNFTQWSSNWVSVQTLTLTPNPTGYVNGQATNIGSPAAGAQGYIWAYSDINGMGNPGTEALLVTANDWVMPGALGFTTFDIADSPFDTADDNMTVVWGRVDRKLSALGGVMQGGGLFTSLPADSASPGYNTVTFEVQTATWAPPPVPEPSSLLLAGLAGLAMVNRRTR